MDVVWTSSVSASSWLLEVFMEKDRSKIGATALGLEDNDGVSNRCSEEELYEDDRAIYLFVI